jgi:oxepin-CoA hydrolase/3-oxo-5,6-dehydrosuberyl-CoA semialdehyde dehydrogenase
MTSTLQSLIAGRWHGREAATPLYNALNNDLIYHTHAENIDFGEALGYARKTGIPALMRLDFQQRAARLKALAVYLMERKEELYKVSHLTGATRADSWVDIEGGIGTLFAFASMGSRELPSSNVLHEGPAIMIGKQGGFAGTHILVPRGGVAVHINAFNFPIWGLLEKFAPSFLAAMPCIGKPATATSYLTEAVVRLIHASGLLRPRKTSSATWPSGWRYLRKATRSCLANAMVSVLSARALAMARSSRPPCCFAATPAATRPSTTSRRSARSAP